MKKNKVVQLLMLGGMGLELEKFMMTPQVFKFDFHRKSDKFLIMVLLELLVHTCRASCSFRKQSTAP